MSIKPLIGISSRQQDLAKGGTQIGVLPHYIDSVVAAGGAPLLIPLLTKETGLRAIYEKLDGVLLPGGEDVDPSLYGEKPHEKLGKIDAQRDALEIELINWAKEDEKPLLAICRGMQILNVALGGSLFQDLRAQCGLAGHDAETKSDRPIHTMVLSEGKISRALCTTRLQVNSFHHQALKEIAPQLRAVGHDENGIIEAVEYKGDWFCIGLQCHPESMWQNDAPQLLSLFKLLIEAADERSRMESKQCLTL